MMDQRMQIKQTNRVAASVQLMISLILNMVLLFNTHFLYSHEPVACRLRCKSTAFDLNICRERDFSVQLVATHPLVCDKRGERLQEIVATTFPMRPENGY